MRIAFHLALTMFACAVVASNAFATDLDSATQPTTQPDKGEGLVIEQQITMEMPGLAMPPQKEVFKLKGLRMRMDVDQMVSVITFEDGRTATIMHMIHSYTLNTISQAKEDADRAASMAGDPSKTVKPKPTPTGKHMKIRGYEADEYTYDRASSKDQASKVTLWIATDFPDAKRIRAEQSAFHDSNKAMKLMQSAIPGPDPKEFPSGVTIRTETDAPNGGKITVDLVSAKFVPVDDSEFELPKGYQQQGVPTVPTGQ